MSWHDPGNSSITKYQYQYVSNEPESMSSDWIDISDSAPGSANASSFTVGSLTNHVTYTFTIRAVNDTGESATSDSAVATPNAEPTFSAGETAVFTVAENTSPGDDIGNPLAATDGDDDALIYILEGSDLEGSDAASFDIVADTGQLKTYDPLDFETKPTYSIIVSVSDLHGGTDSIDVTINVQNVREPPSAPTVSPSATDGHTSLDVQWTAPDTTGLTPVRDYEIQYKVVGPQIWTSHAFTGIDTTTTIGGLSPNTRYEVQIAADNEHGPTGWSESGFGTTNPAPNTTPRVIAPGEDQTLSVGGSPATLDLSSIFSDPDGNPLTYAASSSDAGVVMASTSGSSLTLTPVEAGTATITITATDPSGARVSDQIGVTVSGSATVEEEESPTPEPTAEPTPAPTVAPTLAPSPTPPPAVQEILEVFEESPEQAGELVGQIADDDPEEAGDLIAETALHDLQATGLIVCEAVKGHAGGIGRALGHGAGQDAGTINRALGTVAGDGDCVSQLGGEIPVGPWIPEQPPQEGQDPTGEGEWQDVGSPAPVENVLARFFNPMEGAKTNIVNHEGRPAGTEPLPPDRMPYAFVDIGHENFDNEDVVTAHATISVEKEWLTANQVHQWSVQFSRYNDTTSAWTPTQAKRVNEDDAKVYFTVTVPGFSLWAIHGSTEAPAAVFDEDNLSVAPLAVNAGQLVVVSVDVTNKTVESATYFANLWVDSQIGRTDEVVIGAGQTTTVNVPLIVDAPGSYQIRIGSQILDAPLIVVAPGVEPTVAAPAQVATPTQSAPPTVAATVESTPAPAISPTLPPTLPPTIAPAPTPAPAAALPSLEPLLGEIVFSDPNVAAGDPVVVTIPITYAGTSERTVTIETLVAGEVADQREVTLQPGETIQVAVPIIAPADPSLVSARVVETGRPSTTAPVAGGVAAQEATAGSTGNRWLIIVIVVVIVVLIAGIILAVLLRRRR